MTLYLHVLNETPVRLWGLSSHERITRQLRSLAPVSPVQDLSEVPDTAKVLLVRGDYLFDDRVLRALAESDNTLLRLDSGEAPLAVAAHLSVRLASTLRDRLAGLEGNGGVPEQVAVTTPQALCPPYQEQLRKAETTFVLPITSQNRRRLEHLLFGAAYKGITDLVTKWVWPVPAQWGVRLATALGLRPNHITTISWCLAIASGLLFWGGHYGWGLALGWLMTYLDTVDGKLARVTVTSTKVGHLFDHVLDLIHPPFWYLAWALGLSAYHPLLLPADTALAVWAIFIAYTVGRLVEGSFQLWLGRFGIFCWRKLDSYSRLVTARRNPCLILLTLGALAGRPDLGLEAVTLWTLASSAFLILRLLLAFYARASSGPLVSWLAQVPQDGSDRSLALRWFTRDATRPLPDGQHRSGPARPSREQA